jgi:dipeptidyl-peptidase 4
VKTNQPLGTLAAYLLEPASEDGVVTWNLLDRELQPGAVYPIYRLRAAWQGPSLAVP